MNKDPRIVYRSVVNLNHRQRMNNQLLSSFEPQRSIVERNGKQFVTEFKERMERRHVQVFDETTGRMRLFEVVDYIPSRVVRSAKSNPQIQSQNLDVRSSNFSASSSSQSSERTNQSKKTVVLSLFMIQSLIIIDNHQMQANEFELYQRGALVPMNNNNNTRSMVGQTVTNDRHQSNEYDKAVVSSRGGASTQYVPGSHHASSFRHHSPSGSEYSTSTSTDASTGKN